MGTVRCRFTLEVHDQVLLHTESGNGVVMKTYLVSSLIKDVNSPITVLYRTDGAPYPDGTVLAVQADAAISRGTVQAKAYEFEVQPPQLVVVVSAPYTTPPRLFFDAVILREVHTDTWCGRSGVFEIEVAVDFGDEKDVAMQLDARCSLPRQKKAYKKLTELFTTQSVRVSGDITGWVHANMICIEVNSLDPLNKPPPGVGRKLDFTGRGRRSASPVKGVGRDSRRGRAHSPAKGTSPVRASSPVKELSSSFDMVSLRGRSTSPVKEFNLMGPPESPSPVPAIFAQQCVESQDLLLGTHPVGPEPVKSVAIKPIVVTGRNSNFAPSQDPPGSLFQNTGLGTPPSDLFDELFGKLAAESSESGPVCDTDGLTACERSRKDFMKALDESLAVDKTSSNANVVEVDLGVTSLEDPQPVVASLGSSNANTVAVDFGSTSLGDPQTVVATLPANPGLDVTVTDSMFEEFLMSMSKFDASSTTTGAPPNPQAESEKGVAGWHGSYELPPPSSGVWSF